VIEELPALEGAARGTWQAAGARLLVRMAEVVAARQASADGRAEAIAGLLRHLGRLAPHVDRSELTVEEGVPRLNGRALFMDATLVDATDRLSRWLGPTGAGGLWFGPEVEAVEVERALGIVEKLHASGRVVHDSRALSAVLVRGEVHNLGLLPGQPLAPLSQAPQHVTVWQYARTVAAMEGALFPGDLPYNDVRSLAEGLTAAALAHIGVLVSLPFMGRTDSVGRRAADVAVLCLAVGRALGESPEALVDWTLAGLLHEAGRAWPADNEAWSPGARICALSVMQLGDAPRRDAGLARRVVAAVEHGALLAREPYIELVRPRLTSKVIAAARVFLKGRRSGLSALEVTSRLASRGVPGVDAAITALLASVIGPYPVGCLVELSQGEVGVVVDQPWGQSAAGGVFRPQNAHVELLADNHDTPMAPGVTVVLGEARADGRTWEVRRTLKADLAREAITKVLVRRLGLDAAQLGGLW
jgi:hypothetical protein